MECQGVKIFVAMSGGVDSAVTAALLKKQGYGICGVFIRGWYPKGIPCVWREDRRDAMRTAAILNIPFYTFDFGREYKKSVIDYMLKEYRAGRTPNPDVMCNKYIKFDLFLKKAREMGADKIATGHYVRHLETGFPSGNPVSKLLIAKDENKDQSYFLWTLTQQQLKYCLFPIGNYLKPEVRRMAEKFKLSVADKKDSQGLCFVGEFKMEDFLKNYIKPKQGEIINEKGKMVGWHKGVQYYTIGQRQGVGAHGRKPYYVVYKDLKKNILTVAESVSEEKFYKKDVLMTDINWISGEKPDLSKKYLARIRYRQPLQKCRLKFVDSKIKIVFSKPQRAAAPGQSAVIYDENLMLGGGVIV